MQGNKVGDSRGGYNLIIDAFTVTNCQLKST